MAKISALLSTVRYAQVMRGCKSPSDTETLQKQLPNDYTPIGRLERIIRYKAIW